MKAANHTQWEEGEMIISQKLEYLVTKRCVQLLFDYSFAHRLVCCVLVDKEKK